MSSTAFTTKRTAAAPSWFERAWIDQKQLDGRSLLSRVRGEYLADQLVRPRERSFVRTSFWDALLRDVEREDADRHAEDVRLVTAELRKLGPNALTACEFAATRRALCRALAQLAGSVDPDMDLDRAMAQLPEGCRTAFVLHDVEGLEHREIAEILGIAEGTSKSQVHKARMRLRALLGR